MASAALLFGLAPDSACPAPPPGVHQVTEAYAGERVRVMNGRTIRDVVTRPATPTDFARLITTAEKGRPTPWDDLASPRRGLDDDGHLLRGYIFQTYIRQKCDVVSTGILFWVDDVGGASSAAPATRPSVGPSAPPMPTASRATATMPPVAAATEATAAPDDAPAATAPGEPDHLPLLPLLIGIVGLPAVGYAAYVSRLRHVAAASGPAAGGGAETQVPWTAFAWHYRPDPFHPRVALDEVAAGIGSSAMPTGGHVEFALSGPRLRALPEDRVEVAALGMAPAAVDDRHDLAIGDRVRVRGDAVFEVAPAEVSLSEEVPVDA